MRPVPTARFPRRHSQVTEIRTTTRITTTSQPMSIKKTTCLVRRPDCVAPLPGSRVDFGVPARGPERARWRRPGVMALFCTAQHIPQEGGGAKDPARTPSVANELVMAEEQGACEAAD